MRCSDSTSSRRARRRGPDRASGYWFTASTSFANPAVTIARSLSDTFSGIRPQDAPAFVLAQILGALLALGATGWLFGPAPAAEPAAAGTRAGP
jgi:glycerol uptake facilitator-like aquaporin